MEKRARRAGLCLREGSWCTGSPCSSPEGWHCGLGVSCAQRSGPLPPSSRNPEPSLQFTSFFDAVKSVFVLFLSSFRDFGPLPWVWGRNGEAHSAFAFPLDGGLARVPVSVGLTRASEGWVTRG